MAKKKTMEQQITELTTEQRNNLGKIFKKLMISYTVIISLGVILSIGLLLFSTMKAGHAKSQYDAIQNQLDYNQRNNIYNLDLFDESSALFDEYLDWIEFRPLSVTVVAIIAIVAVLITLLIFKIKYPYFSEDKYLYLRKIEKKNNKM